MTKKKALELLHFQREKLLNPKVHKDDVWVAQTASYIKDIYGEKSTEYHIAQQLKFYVITHSHMDDAQINYALSQRKKDILKFVDSWIEIIEQKGVATKPNYLYRLSDAWLTTIITCVVTILFPAIFYLGYWFGERAKLPTAPTYQQPKNQAPDNTNKIN